MNRLNVATLAGALLLGATPLAAEPAPMPEGPAYEALKARIDRLDDAEEKAGSPAGQISAHDAGSREADQAVLAFLQAYPQSPHRWPAVQAFVEHRPYFFTGVKADPKLAEAEVLAAVRFDAAAAAAWRRQADGLLASLDADRSVPDEARIDLHQAYLEGDLVDATNAVYRQDPVDLEALGRRVRAHIARFAGDNKVRVIAYLYIDLLQTAKPEAVLPAWQEFVQSPNARVRDVAASQVRWAHTKAAPIELKFVAADGRAVDLRDLRGRIVLLDFWATWCPPCREEIPNIVATYQKYHDQGFEIVGVALEHTPEPGKLLAFTRSHGMPWAQLDGGKTFQSDAALEFGIYSIPHTVLLDRRGRVTAEDLRGPALGAAVAKALGP